MGYGQVLQSSTVAALTLAKSQLTQGRFLRSLETGRRRERVRGLGRESRVSGDGQDNFFDTPETNKRSRWVTPTCAVKVAEAQRSVAAWIVLEVEQLGAVPTGSR